MWNWKHGDLPLGGTEVKRKIIQATFSELKIKDPAGDSQIPTFIMVPESPWKTKKYFPDVINKNYGDNYVKTTEGS